MTAFLKKITYLLLFVSTIVIFSSAFKSTDDIAFVNESLPFKPTGYYIADVTDARPVKTHIAQLVTRSAPDKTTTEYVDLKYGAAQAIHKFINHNLSIDTSLSPVIINIKEFKLTESALPNGTVDGRIKLQLDFGLKKDYGFEHLVDYDGGLHYTRNINNLTYTEPYLRTVLKNGLVYFNNWIKANTDVNRKLAKSVTISFDDYNENTGGDTIYYLHNRPLTWADFQAKAKPAGTFDAEVMPSFGYDQQAEIINGTIHVKVDVKVYVPKSACWASNYMHDAYGLNHEQRHFDIAKIIAEQFKQKIASQNLTPDNFEAIINMQYLDSYRDMDAMQKAYDKETRHSRNASAQQDWNNRIDKELKGFNVIAVTKSSPLQ